MTRYQYAIEDAALMIREGKKPAQAMKEIMHAYAMQPSEAREAVDQASRNERAEETEN